MIQKKLTPIAAALAILVVCATPVKAADLLSGFGGATGFGDLAMQRNDDGSSNLLNLPFAINFFGNTFNNFYVNNNGNITFNSSLSVYTPNPFPITSQPMIAPYWGDVDTRGTSVNGSNNVWVASPNADTLVVTWDKVGYYSSQTDKLNSFQLVLNKSNTGAGDFNAQFRYNQLQWTTGSASGGVNGLGGTPAQAGYDSGTGLNYYALPGSRTPDVLNLVSTSNVSSATPGLWEFAIRNGALPGSTAANPILPTLSGNPSANSGWSFNFGVQLNQTYYIDPVVATGFNYIVNSGSNVSSVTLPTEGDNRYELWLWYGDQWLNSPQILTGGTTFNFGRGGVNRFSIRGIETSAGIDPTAPDAFVTGMTFVSSGSVDLSMVPITAAVPEPETYAMLLAGLGLLGAAARKRSRK